MFIVTTGRDHVFLRVILLIASGDCASDGASLHGPVLPKGALYTVICAPTTLRGEWHLISYVQIMYMYIVDIRVE